MLKELIVVQVASGSITSTTVVHRECMEEDAHFVDRAIYKAKEALKEACVIFAVDTDIQKSRMIWNAEVKYQQGV